MGGLAQKLRLTWLMMLIGTLSLTGAGIPHALGFAGFYSKDAIIEAATPDIPPTTTPTGCWSWRHS